MTIICNKIDFIENNFNEVERREAGSSFANHTSLERDEVSN